MRGRVRSEDVAAVRERVRIDQVIGELVTLRVAGAGSLKGLCPFHDERSPSLHVTPARGLYYCFGCGEGGDVVDFLMKVDQLTFTEAIEKLAVRAGVALRYEDGGPRERSQGPRRTRLVEANRKAAEWFGEQLLGPEGQIGLTFLAERGFASDAIAPFNVGYAPRSWDALLGVLRGAGFTDSEATAAGLVASGPRGTYDRFRGRLIWPIRDASGEVLGFGARKLHADDEGPKYLNTPETSLYRKSHVLYGLDLARREIARTRRVVLVEGYTDVMAAHLAGVPTAVATCGTAFGTEHAALLRRYLIDDDTFAGEVIFTFDGDSAGQKAALRAFEGDQQFVAQTFIAVSPGGMDPCELRVTQGDAAVRELVEQRIPLFAFAIRSILSGFDLGTAEGRVGGVRRAAPLVARIRDRALRPEYTRLLAGWAGVPEAEVRAAVKEAAGASATMPAGRRASAASPGPTTGGVVARPNARDPRLVVERESLKCVLQVPELVGEWFDAVHDGTYQHPHYEGVRRAVGAGGGLAARSEGSAWLSIVLGACRDDTERGLVRELAVEPLTTAGEPDQRYVTSIMARLVADEVGRRLAELKREMGQLDPTREASRSAELLTDLMKLEDYRRTLQATAMPNG
jgi:DNA primase